MTPHPSRHSPRSQEQGEPVVESVVRIHYDNDLDDNISGPEEERPLIAQSQSPSTTLPRLTARSNLRSIGRAQEGSDHSLHTLQGADIRFMGAGVGWRARGAGGERGEMTMAKQWGEWCMSNGLHPSTWTGQTYIKAALLTALVTLVVLAFTVLRVQDHVKDILGFV
ncbi:hypothetical protein F5H01DRAFT_216896 [Linnemannia elongata]|nr:hypothetical protein F5H01DRAFT_216896 [Linnemannia elongata]